MLIPSLPHMHFFHFSDKCYLGSNGFIKFLEGHSSTGSQCYGGNTVAYINIVNIGFRSIHENE
jgi:hypothetical protein